MAQSPRHDSSTSTPAPKSAGRPSPAGDPSQARLQVFRSRRVLAARSPAEHPVPHPAAIHVESGKITTVSEWDKIPAAAELIDFGNLVLMPGLVDTHVHINEADGEGPPAGIGTGNPANRRDWEGFRTASQAAASGGVTTLVDMPLNCQPETLTVAALEAKRHAARGQSLVDWMSWGGVVGNQDAPGNLTEIAPLIAAGVPGFKCFLIHSGINGFAWVDEARLRQTFAALSGTGLPLLCHAELAGPIDRATSALQAALPDWRIYDTYLASRPDDAELEAIALLLKLAAHYDVHVHIVHLASADALPMLREARATGLKVSVETVCHYLHFAAEEVPDGATQFKCAPPIRSTANREALWRGLIEGDIDLVATDHSPCSPALKQPGRFDQAWGGIASLGLALPVLWTGLEQRLPHDHGNLDRCSRWLSSAPASLASLSRQKGSFSPGRDADIAVFDPEQEWTVTSADLYFRHPISPYLGSRLTGRVVETWLRGERIFSLGGDSGRSATGSASGRELQPGRRSA